jgi:hypothetical protein
MEKAMPSVRYEKSGTVGHPRSCAAVKQVLKAWSSGGVAGADAVMLDVTFSLHEAQQAAHHDGR